MRADFYDRPLLDPEFAELFTSNVVNVVPLARQVSRRLPSNPPGGWG